MSQREITLEQDFQESLRRAKKHITHNQDSKHLIHLLAQHKLKKMTNRNEKKINELAQLGVVNLYMDNTVTLSKLGKNLVKMLNLVRELRI
jgi:hypothetical protein